MFGRHSVCVLEVGPSQAASELEFRVELTESVSPFARSRPTRSGWSASHAYPAGLVLSLGVSLFTSRTVQHSPWPLRSHGAIAQDNPAVDDDIAYSNCILVGPLKTRTIRDRLRVDEHDIRFHSWSQRASVPHLQPLCGKSRHLSHGLFQGQHLRLADVDREHARERRIASRVRRALPKTGMMPSDPIIVYGDRMIRRTSSSLIA